MYRDINGLALIGHPCQIRASRIRCPDDETGKNSVMPWIIATRISWKSEHS